MNILIKVQICLNFYESQICRVTVSQIPHIQKQIINTTTYSYAVFVHDALILKVSHDLSFVGCSTDTFTGVNVNTLVFSGK